MALDVCVSPIKSRLKWSEINSQLVSPWIPTKSFSLSLFFDLVPENPKSMDSPWNGRVALRVVLCPAGSLVCLERMQVGHLSRTGSKCLNLGTPSMNLCAVYRRSSDG